MIQAEGRNQRGPIYGHFCPGDCPPGWQKTGAGCYKLFKDRRKDKVGRKVAQRKCANEVIFASAPENCLSVTKRANLTFEPGGFLSRGDHQKGDGQSPAGL